ncbi:MAG: hypothetical protein HYT73_00905 [Candidatus Aenigmarchaeota archaeon]|nr:hypothetical protein [Candidatus Aenigmarchaeota archaeon]
MFGDPTAAVGGHVLGHACVTGDTLVQLSDGEIKEIKDVQPERFVSIDFSKIKSENMDSDAKFVNREIKEIYEIDTGYKIKASGLHRFFRVKDFGIEEVKAEDIRAGDYIAHASDIKTSTKMQKLPEIDVDDFVTVNRKGSELIKNGINNMNLTRKELCSHMNFEPRHFRRILNQQYATNMKNIHKLIEIGLDDDILNCTEPYESQRHRKLTFPSELNAEMSQLLGYFIGDGSLSKFSIEFKDQRRSVLEHYNGILSDLFGIYGKISKVKDKNCFRMRLNSISVVKLMTQAKKDMFSLVSRSANEQVSAFIRGFADAEGYVHNNRPAITIAQKDEKLIKFIQMLLLRYGIESCINAGTRSWHLIIEGRHIVTFHREIGLTAEDKNNLLERWVEHCENTYTKEIYPFDRHTLWDMLKDAGLHPSLYMRPRSAEYKHIHKKELAKVASALKNTKYSDTAGFLMKILHGDIMLKKIRKIRKMPNSEPLYDLSIPKNHNYIANGFVVHNSSYRMYLRKSKGNNRIARLIDSPSLPEGEAVFTVTESGLGD